LRSSEDESESEDEAEELNSIEIPWREESNQQRLSDQQLKSKMVQPRGKNNRSAELQRKHPYNLIVEIISTIKLRGMLVDIRGIGTLISKSFVLTCAHNIYYKI